MSVDRLKNAFELESGILGVSARTCPEAFVNKAEADLGVVFPPTYRYYLLNIHPSTETPLFGVEVNQAGEYQGSSVVYKTYDLRNWEDVPENYILVDKSVPFQHVIDVKRVDQDGLTPVLSWHKNKERVVYPDFSYLYLELVDGAIYDRFLNKAEEAPGGLNRIEVEEYIKLHKILGFSENDHKFLKQHWEDLLAEAN